MTLEVCEDQHGVIVQDVLAEGVGLQDLAVRDVPDDVRAFGVHEVDRQVLGPAVVLEEREMAFGMVADTAGGIAICGVIFNERAVHFIEHRFPECRTDEVLVALLTGMDFDSYFPGKVHTEFMVEFNDLFRRDLSGEIYSCSHRMFLSFMYKNTLFKSRIYCTQWKYKWSRIICPSCCRSSRR